MASASSARTCRPVMIISLARDEPTRRGSRWVPPPPGMTPSRISGTPNLESSAPTRKSHASASSRPPPSAKPFTAAIVARGTAPSAPSAAAKFRPTASAPMLSSSTMSAPAAKIRRPPHNTTAPGGSSTNPAAASCNCPSTAADSAFAFGRSSCTSATPSGRRSTVTKVSAIREPYLTGRRCSSVRRHHRRATGFRPVGRPPPAPGAGPADRRGHRTKVDRDASMRPMPSAGWYPDPSGSPGTYRFWDGAAWTEHTYAAGSPGPQARGAGAGADAGAGHASTAAADVLRAPAGDEGRARRADAALSAVGDGLRDGRLPRAGRDRCGRALRATRVGRRDHPAVPGPDRADTRSRT